MYAEGGKISTEALKVVNGNHIIPARSMLILGDAIDSNVSPNAAVPMGIATIAIILAGAAFIFFKKRKKLK